MFAPDLIYRPTSGEELVAEIPNASVIGYSEFAARGRLPPLPCFLLYELSPGVGHWCLIHEALDEHGSPCLEFFDSYGGFPDTQLKYVPKKFRSESGQDHTRALAALKRGSEVTGLPLAFSPARLQQGGRVATCGRHCVMRASMPWLSAEAYASALLGLARANGITADELVSGVANHRV